MPNILKTLGATVLTAGTISAQAGATPEPVIIDLTQQAVLAQLCKETRNQSGVKIDEKDICQVSPDGGKTWIYIPATLVALLGTGFIIRRRKIKSDGSAPETEPTGDGSAPERQEKVILEPEPDTWILTNQLQLYSRFARINPDVRYGIKDITNAKEILQILITAERNVLWESPLEWSNDLIFLERLQETLWSNGFTYNRDIILGIQIIFAIAKQEGEIVSIPEPSQE